MKPETKKEIMEWLKTIIFAVALAFLINVFIAPTIVRGESMFPTLQNSNYLIINKTSYWFSEPKRGDIIVFKSKIKDEKGKNKDLVKRVIGVSKDHVVVKDGKVYINDELQKEDFINGDITDGDVDEIVPEGQVFAMGDNRPNSFDSRSPEVGTVSIKDDIIGKVVIRLFPFNKISTF